MSINIIVNELSGWAYVSLVTSVLTFLITAFYVYKHRSTKAAVIAGSASISALAFVVSNAIFFSFVNNPDIKITVLFVLRGINYSFAFYTVFYAFHRIICNANRNDKLVVYIGYIWMVVTISTSLASTIMLGGNAYYYSDRGYIDAYNLSMLTIHSIWGFVAVTLLLYFTNKERFNSKTKNTMLAFIGLTLIAAITSTIFMYTPVDNQEVADGVLFFLDELTIKAAIIIAACYGSTWIQTDSIENDGSKTETDGDLEANH